jgi:hypothetical protein
MSEDSLSGIDATYYINNAILCPKIYDVDRDNEVLNSFDLDGQAETYFNVNLQSYRLRR